MKSQVDNIIYNSLLKGDKVSVSPLGTLLTFRHQTRSEGGRFLPATKELVFHSDIDGVSIVNIIEKETQIDIVRAAEVAEEWLSESFKDNVLTISGVGAVNVADATVVVDQEFNDKLNPVVARKTFTPVNEETVPQEIPTVQPVAVETPKKEKQNISFAIFAFTLLTIVILIAIFTWNNDVKEDFDLNAYNKVLNVNKNHNYPVDEVRKEAPQNDAEINVEVEPVIEKTVASEENVIPQVEKGMSYIVYGVYAQKENAERNMNSLKRKFPKLNARFFMYAKDKFMISLYEAKGRMKCAEELEEIQDEYDTFETAWVYTCK